MPSSEFIKNIRINKCTTGGGSGGFGMQNVIGLLATNPFNSELNVFYNLEQTGEFQLQLVDMAQVKQFN